MLLVIEVRKLLVSLDIGQDEDNASETFSVKRNNFSKKKKKYWKIFSQNLKEAVEILLTDTINLGELQVDNISAKFKDISAKYYPIK